MAEAALLRDHGHEVELLEEDNRRIEQLGQARTAMRTVWSRESFRRIDELLKSQGFRHPARAELFPSVVSLSLLRSFTQPCSRCANPAQLPPDVR